MTRLAPFLLAGLLGLGAAAHVRAAPWHAPLRACGVQGTADGGMLAYVAELKTPLADKPPGPGRESVPLIQLTYGERVLALCREDDWLQVTAGAQGGRLGWLPARALQARAPQLAGLLRAFDRLPPRSAERLILARRAVALAPLDAGARQRLITALRASGDAAEAQAEQARFEATRSMTVTRTPGAPQVFLIKDNGVLRPLAWLRDGKLAAFADSAPAQAAVTERYLRPGRLYHQIGAGQDDKVMTGGGVDVACGAPALNARGDAPAPGHALASNAPFAAASQPHQVTATQQAMLATIARPVLVLHRLPPHYIAQVLGRDSAQLQRSLVALPQGNILRPMLFGSYALDYVLGGRSGTVVLTVIAQPNANGTYLLAYKEVDQGDGVNGGAFRRFLANADFDGDGLDELVLEVRNGTGKRYEILARDGGRWSVLLSVPATDC